jgi:S-adenosylmethionine decarboxylase
MKHIILDLYACNPEILNCIEQLEPIVYNAAHEAGANILYSKFYQFEPQGATGFLLLAESHISVHTWPEFGFAAVDIFTCGDTVDAEAIAQDICDGLQSKNRIYNYVERCQYDSNPNSRDLA